MAHACLDAAIAPEAPRSDDPLPTSDTAITPRQRWNKRRTEMFLNHLAMTCNVAEALRVSGMSSSSLYTRRRKCAEFRREWDLALEEGYSRLEAELLNRAVNGETQEVVNRKGEVVKIRKVSNALGIALLKLHAARVAVFRNLEGKRTNGKTHEEHALDAKVEIFKKLEMLARHRAREIERGALPPDNQHSPG